MGEWKYPPLNSFKKQRIFISVQQLWGSYATDTQTDRQKSHYFYIRIVEGIQKEKSKKNEGRGGEFQDVISRRGWRNPPEIAINLPCDMLKASL